MALSGEESAAVLLKALPPDVLETVLSRLNPTAADRLRDRVDAARPVPTGTDRLDGAIEKFLTTRRTFETAKPGDKADAGDVKKKPKKPVARLELAEEQEPLVFHHLRDIPPDLLVRVLADEQVPTVAIVMAVLEPTTATDVMRKLPPPMRPELAIRLTQPGTKNLELTELLAKAVVEKAMQLAAAPPEPTADDRIQNLATMLRGLKREERLQIVEALNQSDPETCGKVKDRLYLFEDILRIEDRALQTVLVELDMPTLATALSGATDELSNKVKKNMSSRAQAMLGEEIDLLGSVPQAKVDLARSKIVGVLRQFEEEGKIVIEV